MSTLHTNLAINLDQDALDLGGLPRFQRAAFYARHMWQWSLGIGLLALCMLAATQWLAVSSLRAALVSNGAALLILAAGLQSAYWIARWRVVAAREPLSVASAAASSDSILKLSRLARVRRRFIKWVHVITAWMSSSGAQALWLGIGCLIAVVCIVRAWDLRSEVPLNGVAVQVAGGVALVAGFGMLVFERYIAGRTLVEWPEQAQATQLTRI